MCLVKLPELKKNMLVYTNARSTLGGEYYTSSYPNYLYCTHELMITYMPMKYT